MPHQSLTDQLLNALRVTLDHLESLRMTNTNDPDLVDLKRTIRAKIKEIESRESRPVAAD